MGSSILADLRTLGAAIFRHDRRLLKLRLAESASLDPDLLLPLTIRGEERLSACFRYELDCLSPDASVELKCLFGQPIEIALRLADGGERLLTGLVTEARALGADGGFARYRFKVEPALAALAHRNNSRVFSDKSAPEIVASILDEHLTANAVLAASFNYELRLDQSYPKRSYCVQYRESDLAFIERLLFEEGIVYRHVHGPDSGTSVQGGVGSEIPLHTLVLFDAGYAPPQGHAAAIRFHRTDGTESDDAIDRWEGRRQLAAGRSSLSSYDYKTVDIYRGAQEQRIRHGEAGVDLTRTLESYDPQGPYYGRNNDEIGRYADLRQQARDLANKTFSGAGSARALEVGTWFELQDHSAHDQDEVEDRQFLVTGLTFEAHNNLLPEERERLHTAAGADGVTVENAPYRNTFTAVRRHIPVVPAYEDTRHQKPTAPVATTAVVVGPDGEDIFTDEHGRIKVQFHWQRKQDHPAGGADFDDRSSTWVRVALPSAGAGWGSQYIPRVGQECVVTFLEGDIDRPLVTGVLYNGTHRPPAFSGAGELPANKTLSGHKSKEHKGRRFNELLFDDTTGEIRAKLSSEHGKTQLNQGYLVHPRSDGRGAPRGEGFELRTDEAGALRAAKGLLLTAWQRLDAAGSQLSRDETLSLMETCLDLFKQFGAYGAEHQALPVDAAPQAQLKDAFRNWEHGSNTASGATPAGGAAVIGVSAPAGLSFTTPESSLSYAGKNLDQVAQQHLQLTAGQRFSLNAGRGISLFSHADGLKAIAHHDKLQLHSQHGDTEIAASDNIKLTASRGKTIAFAHDEILLAVEGGAGLRLKGANIELICPGRFSVKAATHSFEGAGSIGTDLPRFAEGELGRKFRLLRPTDGGPLGNLPYRITLADGSLREGTTNAAGETELLESDRFDIARVEFGLPPEA
ncbi:type VI secretion system Vgr family protein [Aromatoleum sp.]|uniref:type VI secretion system Vgr family protein n=1 Tax=Aromatoleum sp. TaxID=2307007 RepID=UPI002FC60759